MSPWYRRRVRPDARGGFLLRLPGPERALLSSLPAQLDALLERVDSSLLSTDTLPDALTRLLPTAYYGDDEAEAAYAQTTRPRLLAARREELAVLTQVVARGSASAVELALVCTALNDLRLVLGTALDVSEDPEPIDEADPAYAQWICYSFLSALQAEVIEALSGMLPPPTPGADEEAPDDPWGEPLGGLRWDGTPQPDQ